MSTRESPSESTRNVLSHSDRGRVAIGRSDRSCLWDRRNEGCLPRLSPLALAADDPTDEADRRRIRGDHYHSGTEPPNAHQSAREESNLAGGRSGSHNETEAGTRLHNRSHGDARALKRGVRVRDSALLSLQSFRRHEPESTRNPLSF